MKRFSKVMAILCAGVFLFSAPAQAKKWRIAFLNQELGQDLFDPLVKGRDDAIKDMGLVEGKNYKVIMEKTFPATKEGGKSAAQATMKALDKGVDLVVTMGTAPSVGAWKVLQRSSVPQVYMAVTDPVASDLISEEGKPTGTNITGVSYFLDPREELRVARALLPGSKKHAFIYMSTVGADASRKKQLEQLEAAGGTYGFEIVYADILDEDNFRKMTADSPIADSWSVWLGFRYKKDLVYECLGQSMPYIGSNTASVVEIDPNSVAGICPDTYVLGRQAGVMAGKIMLGEIKAGLISPERPKKIDIYINTTAALNFKNVVLSYEIMNEAREIFGEAKSFEEWKAKTSKQWIDIEKKYKEKEIDE